MAKRTARSTDPEPAAGVGEASPAPAALPTSVGTSRSLGSEMLTVARLLRPQGRHGELLAEAFTDHPGILVAGRMVTLRIETGASAATTNSSLRIRDPSPAGPGSGGSWSAGPRRAERAPSDPDSADSGSADSGPGSPNATELRVEEIWFPSGKNAGRVVLKLSGCNSISQAERLAGAELQVPVAELPALEPDTFFTADLIGCELYDGATLAGSIVDVQFPVSSAGRRLDEAAPLLAIQPPARMADSKPGSDPDRTPDQNHIPGVRSTQAQGEDNAPEPVLVPFVRVWLESVDLPGRRVIMHLPPGLLEDL